MEMQATSVLFGNLGKGRRSPSSKLPSYETTIPPVHHHCSTESIKHSCCLPDEIVFTWIKTVMKISSQILFFRRPCTDADGKFHIGAGETEMRTMDLRLDNRSPLVCLLPPGGHHHQQGDGQNCLCIELLTNGGIQPPHTGIPNE